MCKTATYTRQVRSNEVLSVRVPTHEVNRPHDQPDNFVVFATGTRAQLAHLHSVTDLTKTGQGVCHPCGLTLWSAAWVSVDAFGEARGEYLSERIRTWVDLVNRDHFAFERIDALVASVRPALLAMLDPAEPAVLVGKCASVPQMERI